MTTRKTTFPLKQYWWYETYYNSVDASSIYRSNGYHLLFLLSFLCLVLIHSLLPIMKTWIFNSHHPFLVSSSFFNEPLFVRVAFFSPLLVSFSILFFFISLNIFVCFLSHEFSQPCAKRHTKLCCCFLNRSLRMAVRNEASAFLKNIFIRKKT